MQNYIYIVRRNGKDVAASQEEWEAEWKSWWKKQQNRRKHQNKKE